LIGFVPTAGGDGSALDELAMLDWGAALSALDELSEVGEISLLGGISVVLNTLSTVDSAAVLDSHSGDADDDDGPPSGVVDRVSVRMLQQLLNCAGSKFIPSQSVRTTHSLTHTNKVVMGDGITYQCR
jgi:hypothetical protein